MDNNLAPLFNFLRLARVNIFPFQAKIVFVNILLLFTATTVLAQLRVQTNRATSSYQVGETATFNVSSNASGPATYEIRYDNFAPAVKTGEINLNAGGTSSISYRGDKAESVVCIVKQTWQVARAPAMFSPFSIGELEGEPGDYDSFWNNKKANLSATPLNPQVNLLYQQGNSTTYSVSFGSVDGRRVYGYLSIPNGAGPFPAVITVPPFGASGGLVQPEPFLAENGNVLSLAITIHNAPPNQTDPNAYNPDDITNREGVYYRYGVMAVLQAINYIHTRGEFNGQLALNGVSQGGGLATIAAGLDNRVDLLMQANPALNQHAGQKYNRASGFPNYLNKGRVGGLSDDQVLGAVKYYDAVYAAKRFNGNSLTVISLLDDVCPPEASLASYNHLRGNKVLATARDLGHNHPEEYWNGRYDMLRKFFPSTQNTVFGQRTTTGYFAEAGDNAQIATGGSLSLSGKAFYNNAENFSWAVKWEKVSGPGSANFSSSTNRNTNVSFTAPGTYVLRFTAEDSQRSGGEGKTHYVSDHITVTVGGQVQDNIRPNVNISNDNASVEGPFQININFSESVNGLSESDFIVSNGSISNLSGSGANYTAQISPQSDGQVLISLPANVANDAAGNPSFASNVLSVNYTEPFVDNEQPSANLSTANNTVTGAFQINISFTENISGLNLNDFNITNGSLSSLSGSGSSFTAQVTPQNEGTVSISLSANAVNDQAGNGNFASNTLNVTYEPQITDTQRPDVTLTTSSATVSGTFQINIIFTEAINGLELNDFSVSNGSVSNLNGSGNLYTVQVTPQNEGTVSISLSANAVNDQAGNGNFSSNTLSVTYEVTIVDTERPSVTLFTANTSVDGPFTVNINFTESVTGLVENDVIVQNATLSQFSGSGNNYSILVSPIAEGQVSIQLFENSVTDAAGNGNTNSNQLLINYQNNNNNTGCQGSRNLALTGTATQSSTFLSANPERANDGNLDGNFNNGSVTATASEFQSWWEVDLGEVSQIDEVRVYNRTDNRGDRLQKFYVLVSDVPFVSTELSAVLAQSGVSQNYQEAQGGTPSTFAVDAEGRYVRIQLAETNHLTLTEVEVMGCSIDDNGNTDTERPTVALNTASLTVSGAFLVDVNFSEAVSGLGTDDFSVQNATLSQFSGSENNYSMLATPIADGEVRIQLLENGATDAAGNGNNFSNLLTVNYQEDNGTTVDCEESSNLALAGTASQSSVVFGAEAGRAIDGNLNGDFNSGSVTATNFDNQSWWEVDLGQLSQIDEIRVWNRTDNRSDRLQNFYVLVSEEPFASTNLNAVLAQDGVFQKFQAAQGGSPSNFTVGTEARYVRIQLQGADHLTLTEVEVMGCPADDNNTSDNIRPGVSLYSNRDRVEGSFLVSALFTEPIEGFSLADISIANGFASNLEGSNNEYRFFVTPNNEGEVRVGLDENQVFDAAGNGNWGSNVLNVIYEIDVDINNSEYCEVGSSNANFRWIEKVKLGGFERTSGQEQYADFTDETIGLQAGNSFPIELTPGYNGGISEVYWRVWIDFNHNGDFTDPGEMIFASQFANTISGIVWIPSNVMNGTTRMRVAMGANYYVDPCGTFIQGEVEDYTVNITGSTSIRETVYFQAQRNNREVDLFWASNEGYKTDRYVIEHSMNGRDYQPIYNEINQVKTGNIVEYDFIHRSPETGINYYRLKMFFDDGTYIFTQPQEIIFDIDLLSFTIYPNPTQQDIYINARLFSGNKGQVKVYDLLGRVVFEKQYDELPDHPIAVSLNRFETGVYNVFLIVDNKRIEAQKFVYKKL